MFSQVPKGLEGARGLGRSLFPSIPLNILVLNHLFTNLPYLFLKVKINTSILVIYLTCIDAY